MFESFMFNTFCFTCLSFSLMLYSNDLFVMSHLFLFFVFGLFLFKHFNPIRKIEVPGNFRVLIVGAGFSGICMGKKLSDLGVKYMILEKSSQLGGTWWENTYPGCGCDIPSHLYSFSFFLNPSWSKVYSKQKEILEYLKTAAQRFSVSPNILYNQHVTQCTWDKTNNQWQVITKAGRRLTANILVSGAGILHVPHIPEFEESEKFQGVRMHTAQWNDDWNPTGQNVGIIGTGASAVQAIPMLAKSGAKKLFVFQRTPCWSPCFTPDREENVYPDWIKYIFNHFPFTMRILRTFYFLRGEFFFHTLINTDRFYNKLLARFSQWLLCSQINRVVKDPATATKLTPSYELGCKRVTPSDYYLPTFNNPDVELVTDTIQKFSEDGIKTSARSYKVDSIIYATGYDLLASSYGYEIINKHGVHNKAEFGNAPEGYLGKCHPNYPNHFWLLGPGTGLGTSSVVFMIECQVDFVIDCIRKMLEDGAKSLTVKEEVNDKFKVWRNATMQTRVFGGRGSCLAWYKNQSGENWTLWPSDLIRYWKMTRTCCWEEFDRNY